MDIRWVSGSSTTKRRVDDLPGLLASDEGFTWVDFARCDREATVTLQREFGLHPLALRDCEIGVTVPRFRIYRDHVFLVFHTLRRLPGATLELVQFNQFVGRSWLVTIHGPVPRHAPYALGVEETREVAARIDAGTLEAPTPVKVASLVIGSQATVLDELVTELADSVLDFERRTATDSVSRVDAFLDGLFRLRLDLGVIRATAFNNRQICQRAHDAIPDFEGEVRAALIDLRDQFDRVGARCDSEKELLQDVLDFYQARLTNDLNLTLKRFTSVGAILVSCTLVTGIYGMNFEHMPELSWKIGYPLALLTMAALASGLALLFRRKGWL